MVSVCLPSDVLSQCLPSYWGFSYLGHGVSLHGCSSLDSIFKSRDITLPTKVHLIKAMVFLVVMYGYESWTIKKAECQRINAFELWVLEKTLESPLDCKEIQPDHPKGDESWLLIGKTDVEAETPILRPPNAKN